MSNFLRAFAQVLIIEDGYVDDPDDKGGETKYGISKASFPNEDIRNLTLDRAMELYEKCYWKPMCLSQIANQEIAEELFDTAVNMGVKQAVRIAQEAIGLLPFHPGLKVDGVMGPQTLSAINSYRHHRTLLKVLNGLQFEHYRKIVKSHPSQAKFFRGWMRRIEL